MMKTESGAADVQPGLLCGQDRNGEVVIAPRLFFAVHKDDGDTKAALQQHSAYIVDAGDFSGDSTGGISTQAMDFSAVLEDLLGNPCLRQRRVLVYVDLNRGGKVENAVFLLAVHKMLSEGLSFSEAIKPFMAHCNSNANAAKSVFSFDIEGMRRNIEAYLGQGRVLTEPNVSAHTSALAATSNDRYTSRCNISSKSFTSTVIDDSARRAGVIAAPLIATQYGNTARRDAQCANQSADFGVDSRRPDRGQCMSFLGMGRPWPRK